MNKIKVSAVSYTNTYPFLNGIRSSSVINEIDLSVDYPSLCALKVIDGEVDLGIIPVAAILNIKTPYIITDYCIGTEGAVDSVFIFSEKPIHDIKTLRLDKQSRTSNGLARILLKYFWKVDIQLVEDENTPADAYVLIGDRTFGMKDEVPYAYDLGQEWRNFTGFPFAFALWVSNKKLPDEFISAFNEALKKGVENIDEVIATLPSNPNFDYAKYLKCSLNYHLTDDKRTAVEKYWELYKTL